MACYVLAQSFSQTTRNHGRLFFSLFLVSTGLESQASKHQQFLLKHSKNSARLSSFSIVKTLAY